MNTTYDYDIFGSPITGNYTTGTDYGYLGKPYDSITGLYNYGYRDYSPQTVRFTTVDPIRDGSNWFAYVNNDPVNYVDLWGLLAGDLKTYQLDNFPQNFPVSPTVGTGDTVKKATVIGLSGGNPDDPYSGKTTGSHLHFEQRINGESADPFSSIFYFGLYTVSVEEVQ